MEQKPIVTELDFNNLMRRCPFSCCFMRQKRDTYLFLCLAYKCFLDVDKDGTVYRCPHCGENMTFSDYAAFKDKLEKMDWDTLDEGYIECKNVLQNIFQVLDKSEQAILTTILESPMLSKNFMNQFDKQPQDDNLLKNTRAILRDMEENEISKDPVAKERLGNLLKKKRVSSSDGNDAGESVRLARLIEMQQARQDGR